MNENGRPARAESKGILGKRALLAIGALAVILMVGVPVLLLKASEKPSFCASCHIIKPYYDTWNGSILLAGKHAEAEINCQDCHESSISKKAEEGFKYITGDYQTPLEKRDFTMDFCLQCHDDFDSIIAKTNFEESNPHDSHNGELECSTCHSMHQQSRVMCSECHSFGWMRELDDSWAQSK